jgi:hypothetical protein
MKLKIFFSFVLILLLSNCAGTGTKNLSQLSFQNKPGESGLFFVRPERFVAGGGRVVVFVNGQEIGKLGIGEIEKIPIKAGAHSINIKPGDIHFGVGGDAYSIVAEQNKNYFFIVDYDAGFFGHTFKITETSEQGFRKALN